MNRQPFNKAVRSDTVSTIHYSASFSELANCSVVSAITLEDELFATSDQRQYLSTLEERMYASDPTTFSSPRKCADSPEYDRFSSCRSDHRDNKTLCPIPQRMSSQEFSSPSSSKQTTRREGRSNRKQDLQESDNVIGNLSFSISSDDTYPTFATQAESLDLFDVFGHRYNTSKVWDHDR
ncbi:unnamed protein product [Cylindrotheca closterium]|uniref:Uncharacterized protein n=1 Tax=Cylindrotheca closterium TaxID=2856 RepID=A0AAD2CU02_9STRA|nr:unnamed protein product [Cylindrotheca closterium]